MGELKMPAREGKEFAETWLMEPNRDLESRTMARVTTRLIPYLFLLYVVAYLDRVNVGFAALQMNKELGFSDEVFGFGAGVFFFGYMLLQVPSNLVLEKLGARKVIGCLMVIWGFLSMAMMLVKTEQQFYAMRFLLGLAEAGFFPGVILYLTWWFPAHHRARAVALFMTATAVSGIVGGPVSGYLLTLEGRGGLSGWHWLFLLEGAPAVLFGLGTIFWLTDRPSEADWLEPEERDWLESCLAEEHQATHEISGNVTDAFRSGTVWLLSLIYFCLVCCMYGVTLWLPQIIASFSGQGDLVVGFLSALPYLAAAIGMVVMGRRSDRTGERRKYVTGSALLAGFGFFVCTAFAGIPALSLAALCLGAGGLWSTMGPFWSLPPLLLRDRARAAGIAVINSVGNLGGFAGPYLVGWLKQTTGNFSAGIWGLATLAILGGLLVGLPGRSKGA